MPIPERDGSHFTYLLSLWREGTTWRAAPRPADGCPRKGFGDLEQLVAFLLGLQEEHGFPGSSTDTDGSHTG